MLYKSLLRALISVLVIALLLIQLTIPNIAAIKVKKANKEKEINSIPIKKIIKNNDNPIDYSDVDQILTYKDEGHHYPCGYELWCYHAALTLENGERWDSAATFVYFMNKSFFNYEEGLSWLRIRHWNRQTNKFYDYFKYDEFPGEFKTEENIVNLSYYESSINGSYPDYQIYCKDTKYNIISDLNLHSISFPCWLFNDTANQKLPWGFTGWGKAYFIPFMKVNGTVTINGTTYNATGHAYFEHDFAYVDFADPFSFYSPDEFLVCAGLTIKSAGWLLKQAVKNRPKEPLSFHRSNDYMFGWCWSWVVLDNNWSIVIFRPTILGRSKGRIPIFLYLTKDQQHFYEIGNVYWNNLNEKYIPRADIYIPEDFEIAVYRKDMEFKFKFTATSDMTELFSEDIAPYNNRESCTFYTCGTVKGYYKDNEHNVTVNGTYAIEQSRWLSRFDKHRSFDLTVLIPPHGLGIIIRKKSHILGVERFFKFTLKPRPEFQFYIINSP